VGNLFYIFSQHENNDYGYSLHFSKERINGEKRIPLSVGKRKLLYITDSILIQGGIEEKYGSEIYSNGSGNGAKRKK